MLSFRRNKQLLRYMDNLVPPDSVLGIYTRTGPVLEAGTVVRVHKIAGDTLPSKSGFLASSTTMAHDMYLVNFGFVPKSLSWDSFTSFVEILDLCGYFPGDNSTVFYAYSFQTNRKTLAAIPCGLKCVVDDTGTLECDFHGNVDFRKNGSLTLDFIELPQVFAGEEDVLEHLLDISAFAKVFKTENILGKPIELSNIAAFMKAMSYSTIILPEMNKPVPPRLLAAFRKGDWEPTFKRHCPEMMERVRKAREVAEIWKAVKENSLIDVDFPPKGDVDIRLPLETMAEIGELLGADTYIDALASGVPVELLSF